MGSRNMRVFYGILIGLIPVIATAGLLRVIHQSDLYHHVPTYSDEILYWRETQTFMTAGFDGGYYTWSEKPARATFSRFYAHGPVFAAVTGALASVTGWYLYSLPVFNLVVLFLALFIFVYVTQPDRTQLGLLLGTLLTFWPMLLYTSLTMQESFNQAIAILLAAFFSIRFFSDAPPRWLPFAILTVIFFGALIRPTWALLASALFLIPADRMSRSQLIAGLLKTAVFCAALFGLSTYWNSPYPNVLARFFAGLSNSVNEGISILANNVVRNLYNASQGNWLEIGQRLQIIALLLGVLIVQSRTRGFARLRTWLMGKNRFTQAEILFHVFNIGFMFGFNLIIYDFFAWRDYRVLAPHLLLSILILICARRYKFVFLNLLISVLLFPTFISGHYDLNTPTYSHDLAQLQPIAQQIEMEIPLNAAQESGWCRTVLSQNFPIEVLFFPPDMGISFYIDADTLTPPIRSQYLLVREADIEAVRGHEAFERLASINGLTLFYNADSNCER